MNKKTSTTKQNETSIEIKSISKTYKAGDVSVQALRDVSLTLKKGDFVSIMGPSGGGKTTLLNCMGGLETPDSGDIWIDGELVSEMDDRELTHLRRERIGFVFQFYNLLPTLTLWENVELPSLLNPQNKTARKQIGPLLEYVGLKDRASSFPIELSGGQMQRVAIARALVHHPAIVLADEPTGNLDSENGRLILDLLKRSAKDFSTTVVVVTHNLDEARLGNRHFEILDGRIKENLSSPSPNP